MKDGLVFDNVVHLSEDDEGLLYISTSEGLNIYNGNKFLLYNQYNTPHFSNRIWATLPVKKGFVLLVTQDKGLFLHDKFRDSILSLQPVLAKNEKLPEIHTVCLQGKTVWMGCRDGRLFSFSLDSLNRSTVTKPSFRWNLVAQLPFSVEAMQDAGGRLWIGGESNSVYSVKKTGESYFIQKAFDIKGAGAVSTFTFVDGSLVIGTHNGLYKTGLPLGEQTVPGYTPVQSWALEKRVVRTVSLQKERGVLWVGTEGEGLYKLSLDGRILEHYYYAENKRNSINSNYVLASLIDRQQNLVTGTWYGGINLLRLQEESYHFVYDGRNENDIFSNIVWSSTQTPDGTLYLGTHGNGLAVFTPGDKNFEAVSRSTDLHSILSLYYDSVTKLLFIGTWGHGVKVYHPQTRKRVTAYDRLFEKVANDRIYAIVRDAQNDVWVGTYKNGLFRLVNKTNQLVPVQLTQNSAAGVPDIRVIYPEGDKGLWVGSLQQGLFFLKPGKAGAAMTVTHYTTFQNTGEPLSIENLYVDRLQRRWLLCRNGLGRMNDKGPEQLNLLRGNVLTAMLEDSAGHFWISSYKGLYRLDQNLRNLSGLATDRIFFDLLYLPQNNTLFAASNKGLLALQPGRNVRTKQDPEIYFAALKILGETIGPGDQFGGKTVLTQKINYTDTLRLPYSATSFSLELNTLPFYNNPKAHFQYRLKGYDKVWNQTNGTAPNITYTNVPPGSYTFEVKTTDENNHLDGKIRRLQVQIANPWWTTLPALLAYLFVSGLLGWWVRRELIQRVKMKRELLAQKAQQEKEQALYQQKMEFFTNISHDLRTPLTLILGPLEDILGAGEKGQSEEQLHKLNRIHRNASMLMGLVNQILDFRKAETNHVKLDLRQIPLHDFVQNVYRQFKELAFIKHIDFTVTLPPAGSVVVADPVMLESIFFNLVSNALKFTPGHGQVHLYAGIEKNDFKLVVSDSGIGIPAGEADRLFTPFYRGRNTNSLQGTGIGMALVKKYIELHNGSIHVSGKESCGSTFEVTLPIPENRGAYALYLPVVKEAVDMPVTEAKAAPAGKFNHTVLVVDDNCELRDYLSEILSGAYRVLTAEDGNAGLSIAATTHIDLVLSDIMMEGMDGIEFCRRIKENINTSHLPFILLTAKHTTESKIEAFETGADAYIEKPFNSRLLLTRVQKLIEDREKLKARFLQQDPILKEAAPSKVDEEFLEKLTTTIHQHLDEPEYQVSDLATSMLMSQDQLYRKVKALTGLSVNHYIRYLRLTEAKKLLATKRYTVSEIVFMVGFNNASYFTRAFKKEFGVLPKEYSQVKL